MNRRKNKLDYFFEWATSENGSSTLFRACLVIGAAFILASLIVDYIIF